MAEGIARDLAITWTGSAGCVIYLWTLYRHGRRGVAAQRFLVILFATLLFVRGFDWLLGLPAVGRLTFAVASGLPLAVTLFIEQVLRRHSPLWVKWLSLGATVVFFFASLLAPKGQTDTWLVAFAACFALVVLVNGLLLLTRRRTDLSAGENHLAATLVLLAFIAAPLVVTDFRMSLGFPAVRMGALAALLFAYSMVGTVLHSASVATWMRRYLSLLSSAVVLSALVVFGAGNSLEDRWSATIGGVPLAFAWMLLIAIVVNSRSLWSESDTHAFLRWLTRVSFVSSDAFLAALGGAPDSKTHVVLGPAELADYDVGALAGWSSGGDGVASLGRVRRVRAEGGPLREGAEQWLDLLERTQMTHGFIARVSPLAVFLTNLPGTTPAVAAETRLRVMRHIAAQLEEKQE